MGPRLATDRTFLHGSDVELGAGPLARPRCALETPRLRRGTLTSHCIRFLRVSVAELASTTVTAVILTMRRTVAAGVKMCACAPQPSRIGPMATLLPAADLSML